LRGAALLARNEIEASIADYSAALKLVPDRFDLLTARAAVHQLKGDDPAALADLDAILGPTKGTPVIFMREDDLARYRFARAQILIRQKRFADASADMMNSISGRGPRSLLRAQIYLRHNGFPETPLDGKDSDALRAALQACFGLNSCFQKISDNL
jgi:tetratricopeptide (TPR) repeat protein